MALGPSFIGSDSLGKGDCLVVYKMDRIARSLKDLMGILERVQLAGANIRSLTEPLDTSVPVGVFMVQVLGLLLSLSDRSFVRGLLLASLPLSGVALRSVGRTIRLLLRPLKNARCLCHW